MQIICLMLATGHCCRLGNWRFQRGNANFSIDLKGQFSNNCNELWDALKDILRSSNKLSRVPPAFIGQYNTIQYHNFI